VEHSLSSVDFRRWTRQEVIEILRTANEPKYEPLIRWIAESVEYDNVSYAIRCDISKSETRVKVLSHG
jgi:hypothetical protein